MAQMTNLDAVNNALHVSMRKDDNVVIFGEDVGKLGGVFRATAGLQKEFGEKRVFDTPLAEAGIVGTAIGMAMVGLHPVAEIQFMGFMLPAINQIIAHAARMRNRTRGRFGVPLVIRMPCGAGIGALEHHAENTEALLAHIPGLKVVMPSTPKDTKGLLIAAIEDPDPVIFLEHKRIYRSVKADVPEDYFTIPIGKADVVREGTDVTLIGWGYMRHLALHVSDLVAQKGISAEVIDLRTVSPIDSETILSSATKTGRVVILQEAPRSCGVGAEIAAICSECAILSLKAPVERVTSYDITMPLRLSEKLNIPSESRVIAAIDRVMKF